MTKNLFLFHSPTKKAVLANRPSQFWLLLGCVVGVSFSGFHALICTGVQNENRMILRHNRFEDSGVESDGPRGHDGKEKTNNHH